MLDYGNLEVELATRLNAFFAKEGNLGLYIAVPIFNNQKEFNDYQGEERNFVVVQWLATSPEKNTSIGQVLQREEVTIRFIFRNFEYRGPAGFYTLLKDVKRCLVGYQPENCSLKLSISKYDLVEYANLGIVNTMEMITETTTVQEDASDPPLVSNAVFKQIID